MFSAKDNDDSFVRKHTHHTTGGGRGGERSELHHSHGRKQTPQTTGEEGDLPDLSNMQVLHKVTVTYQNASNCGTYTNTIPLGGGRGGGLASTAPYICTRMSWKSSEHSLMCPLHDTETKNPIFMYIYIYIL